MEEIFAIINKIAGASFASLLAIILYANWKGYWMWTKDHDKDIADIRKQAEDQRADLSSRIVELRGEKDKWQDMAVRQLQLAAMATDIAKQQQVKS
jgi:hypothetical protein